MSLTKVTYTDHQTVITAANLNAIQDEIIDKCVTVESKSFTDAQKKLARENIGIDVSPSDILYDNAGAHNSIYRGENLGTAVTSAQWAAIKAGTFDDMYIGDYWTINSVVWRIAAFDYWLKAGDTECTKHHVVIVPDTNIASSVKMNDTNTTEGAYVGSDFYTGNNSNTGKATATAAVNNAFGSGHILSHREYLKNAITDNYESAGAWYDSTIDLMNEQMVYGGKIFSNVESGTALPALYTNSKSQLPLFALDASKITNRSYWWLRDVVSAARFAIVFSGGGANYSNAGTAFGIRPAFAIYQS